MIIKVKAVSIHFIYFLVEIVILQQVEYLHNYSKIEQDMQDYAQLEIILLYLVEEYLIICSKDITVLQLNLN